MDVASLHQRTAQITPRSKRHDREYGIGRAVARAVEECRHDLTGSAVSADGDNHFIAGRERFAGHRASVPGTYRECVPVASQTTEQRVCHLGPAFSRKAGTRSRIHDHERVVGTDLSH